MYSSFLSVHLRILEVPRELERELRGRIKKFLKNIHLERY